jgi:hypothetical protein
MTVGTYFIGGGASTQRPALPVEPPHLPAQHLVVASPTMHPLLQARNKLFSRTMRAHHLTADVCDLLVL